MEGNEEEAKNLEICSYRYLQQVAKSMGLPSNVKRVWLIKLINAKKYGTQQAVEELVRQVRQERQQLSQARKKTNKSRKKTNVQSTEISSTGNSLSPPITTTPTHRRHVIIRYSPERHSPKKYPENISTRRYNLNSSDRVLRSCNRVKKPSYLLNNTLYNLLNGSDTEDGSEVYNTVNVEITKEDHGYSKKSDGWKNPHVPLTRNVHTSPPPRSGVQRRISGIYPLHTEEVKVPSVAIRRPDGTITKLRAIIQKPTPQRKYSNDRKTYNTNSSLLRTSDWSYTVTTTPQFTHSSTYRSSNMRESTPNLKYRQSNLEAETRNDKQSYNTSSLLRTEATDRSYTVTTKPQMTYNSDYPSSNMRESTSNLNYRQSNLEAEARNNKQSCNISSLLRTEPSDWSYTVSTTPQFTCSSPYPNMRESTANSPYPSSSMREPTPNLNYRQSNLEAETRNDKQSYNTSSSLRTEAADWSYTVTTKPQMTYNTAYPSSNKKETTPNLHYKMSNLSETRNDRQTYNTSSSLLRTEANNWSVTTKPQMTYSKAYPSSNKTYKPSNLESESQNLNNRPSSSTTAPNYSFRSSNTSEIAHSMCNITSNMAQMTPSTNYRSPNSMVNTPENNSNSSNSSSSNSSKSHSSEETDMSNGYKDESDEYSEYCHKKIRRRKVRSSRKKEMVKSGENEGCLPKIDEAFTKFNNVYSRDVSQPLYVHVEVPEPEIAPTTYIPEPTLYQGSSTLEKFYNIKTATAPLLQIYTPSKTTTVYSTPIITTAQATSSNPMHLYNDALVPRDNQQYYMTEEASPRDFFGDFGNLQGRNSSEDFGRSSVETIADQDQELGANVTIPEMVEDALELISQDGDYMERMGMDIRMQCILCNWAGPKILFEYHIRKEHASDIIECSGKEWLATYSLGGLRARGTAHRVLAAGGELYVLSAKYQLPECFMAALSTLSEDDPRKRASLTVYNKLTGEPFTWLGDVPEIDADMDVPTGLRVSLPKVDLLPNSANLQLLDRQLVMRSPSNAIVGQPDLDNIHINLVVKIYD
nr:uncharacterized protein LOC110378052 isoform X2 [Helicoverpa armigera]